MRIRCPYCGERPVEEFSFQGDATKKRPTRLDEAAVEDWFDYVYMRDNVKGRMLEHWHHSGGCRSWLVIDRDTASHEIFAVTTARDFVARGRI